MAPQPRRPEPAATGLSVKREVPDGLKHVERYQGLFRETTSAKLDDGDSVRRLV